MTEQPEVIIVGSGFGGAVTACRLAQAGHRVLVLERGRRWGPSNYPRGPRDPWLFSSQRPHKRSGWLEFRPFPNMVVVAGAGVGGGSLVYANVSAVPPSDTFASGWPPEITFDELRPFYEVVGETLNVQRIPDAQVSKRFELVREGATALGHESRFRKLDLAISFHPDWRYDLEHPFSPEHSRPYTNAQGRNQGTCIHCGMCDMGCPVQAKNTLDLNYLALAEDNGAEIRPLHLVRCIEQVDDGYRVHFEEIDPEAKASTPGTAVAKRLVLAAGSMGSTELLLQSRDRYRTIGRISDALGRCWSANGDFLTPAFYRSERGDRRRREISPTHGPTITCAIDYLDGEKQRQERYVVEDGGVPPLLRGFIVKHLNRQAEKSQSKRVRALLRELRHFAESDDELRYAMPWFANGADAADGRLYLSRGLLPPWRKRLKMHWDVTASRAMLDRVVSRHEELARVTGGKAWVAPGWRYSHDLITPHPLGGCNMASTSENGVVDHRGKVFGHEGLYVIDGAVVPEAIGINPSRTIAALAERCAALLVDEMAG